MSVDSRLRGARPEDDSQWEPELGAALTAVLDRARSRQRRTRRTVVTSAAVAAVLVLAGVAMSQGSDSDVEPAPGPATIVPSPTPAKTKSTPDVDPGVLGGQWQTPLLTRAHVVEQLIGAGVPSATAVEFAQGLPAGEFRIHLTVYRGQLGARIDDDLTFDVGVLVAGDTFTLTPFSGSPGTWTLGWQRDADTLTFDMQATDVRDYDGFSARVHALATFCVAPFRAVQ